MKSITGTILFLVVLSARANVIKLSPKNGVPVIKNAVTTAAAGDTILLTAGVYYTNNVAITKPLTVIGQGKVVLHGQGKYEILTISGSGVKITGLELRESGYSSMNDMAAITIVDANNITIENNTFEQTFFGIHVANSRHFVIKNNTLRGVTRSEQTTGNGIHLWKCSNALIENNDASGHRDGIYFEFVNQSSIIRNKSHHNIRYGLHFMFSNEDAYTENEFAENGAGVAVMFSNRVTMTDNSFRNNWGAAAYGLLLKEISDSKIMGNTFFRNTVGIYMEGANRIEVTRNQFIGNGWAARVQASSSDNSLTSNNFISNTFDIATNGSLVQNIFAGNYWDKYEGYDLNRDGTGDVPYHPVSLYSMLIEQNSNSLILLRSFIVTLLDKAEKALPSLTPTDLNDAIPRMKKLQL